MIAEAAEARRVADEMTKRYLADYYYKEEPTKERPMKPETSHQDYYDKGGIEVRQYLRAKLTDEEYKGFCKGNIIKYISRARYKENEKKDCEKALEYCKMLVETWEPEK